jgi:hypothetical protein
MGQYDYLAAADYQPTSFGDRLQQALGGFATGDPDYMRRRKLADANSRMAMELAIQRLNDLKDPERARALKLENAGRDVSNRSAEASLNEFNQNAGNRTTETAQQAAARAIALGTELSAGIGENAAAQFAASHPELQLPTYQKPVPNDALKMPTGTLSAAGELGSVSPVNMLTRLVTGGASRKDLMPVGAGGLYDASKGEVVVPPPERAAALDNSIVHQIEAAMQKWNISDPAEAAALLAKARTAPNDAMAMLSQVLAGAAGGSAPAPVAKPAVKGSAQKLDKETAAKFLQQAGGDKEKARQLAKDAGYSF